MNTRWILDDAERALLAALHEQGIGPMESASEGGAAAAARATHGFDDERLDEAFRSLGEKQLLEALGDGRVRLTRDGFLQASEAADSLRAGIAHGL
jgi:hypothetical protein